MPRSVAIRLGTEGKAQVKADFVEIGDTGDAQAKRWARSFEREGENVIASMQRQSNAAAKLAMIAPQSATQMRINDTNSTGFGQYEGSARQSASVFRELIAAQEQMEVRARAPAAAIDPAFAAQQRFDREMQEARTLISAGAISLDQYVAKLRIEQGALDAATAAKRRANVSTGEFRAGSQQLSYQIGDVTASLASGSSVTTVFAQQIGQTVQAVQLMTGATSGFLGFIAGPWGAVITGGVVLLTNLVDKLWDGSEAAKAKEKAATELAAAMDTLHDSTLQNIMSEERAAELSRQTAVRYYQEALQARELTRQNIALAKSRLAAADAMAADPSNSDGGLNMGVTVGATVERQLKRLEALDKQNDAKVNSMLETVRGGQIAEARGRVTEGMDKGAAATAAYKRRMDGLNDSYLKGKITLSEYEAADRAARVTRDAAVESTKKHTAAHRGLSSAQREGAREAKEQARDLESLEQRFDPATAATKRLRDEMQKLAALGLDPAKAKMFAEGLQGEFVKARAAAFNLPVIEDFRPEGEAEDKRIKDAEAADKRRADFVAQTIAGQQESTAITALELRMLGANDNLREAEIAKLRLIADLKKAGVAVDSAEGVQILANADSYETLINQLHRQQDAWREISEVSGRAIDTLFDPSSANSWGDRIKGVLGDLKSELIKLALINPLKNALFGQSNQTLGSIGGMLGKIGGLFGGGSKVPTTGTSGLLSGNAAGTEWWSGGMMLAGENGAEIISAPRGSRVTNAGETRRLFAGNDNPTPSVTYNHFSGNLMTPEFWERINAGDAGAAMQGAAGGAAMSQAEGTRTAARRLGRFR